VTLQVTDNDGLRDADGTTARIGEFSQPPTADPGGPYNGRVGARVTFDGTASDDPDGRIKRYRWDFGDGTNGRGKAPRHRYRADGVYPVALTVTDNSGETDTQLTFATIGIGNLPPEADAGDTVRGKAGGKSWGKAGRKVTFDGTGSSDPDGSIKRYDWDFGDGRTGKGRKPRHAYAKAGAYRVILTVTDNQGATASDVTLAVIEPIGHPGKDTICIRGKRTVEVWPKVARFLIKLGMATPGECDDDQKK
jgi:PKD repeat protein